MSVVPASGPALLFGMLIVSGSVAASGTAGQEMGAVVEGFSAAWGGGDAKALQSRLASSVRLDLEGQEYLGVSPRQVVASVDRLFRRYSPERPRLSRHGALDGSTDRGFAEFDWTPRSRDSGIVTRYVLFVSLRRSDGEWRISELRILR